MLSLSKWSVVTFCTLKSCFTKLRQKQHHQGKDKREYVIHTMNVCALLGGDDTGTFSWIPLPGVSKDSEESYTNFMPPTTPEVLSKVRHSGL